MRPEDIKNNDAAMAYFEGRSLGLVKRDVLAAGTLLYPLVPTIQLKRALKRKLGFRPSSSRHGCQMTRAIF